MNDPIDQLEKIKNEDGFRPFEKVLVRNNNSDKWRATFFSHENTNDDFERYVCVAYTWSQCIPYDGNEHLLGTNNSPEE